MQLLDNDTPSPRGRNLGAVAAVAFVLACIGIIIQLYGAWESHEALNEAGSPDAVRLADSILFSALSQLITMFLLVAGLICQWLALSKHQYGPIWMWRLMLLTCLLVILACIFAWSLLLLIPGIILGVHVLSKRELYN